MSKNPKLYTFEELLDEISYSWEPGISSESVFCHNIIKEDDECYSINKLYITPDRCSYKTDNFHLAPGVFEKFVAFYKASEKILFDREVE
jgi:hypothetical protein